MIEVDIPDIINAKKEFSLSLSNDDRFAVDVIIRLEVATTARNFSLDGSPVDGSHTTTVAPRSTKACKIKEWGTGSVGQIVKVTGTTGTDPNKTDTSDEGTIA